MVRVFLTDFSPETKNFVSKYACICEFFYECVENCKIYVICSTGRELIWYNNNILKAACRGQCKACAAREGCEGVKNSWKTGVLAACAMLFFAGTAAAESTLLAETELQLTSGSAAAELWGERLSGGYAQDLLVLLKDGDKIITAYAPSIKGGYNCMLQAVQVKPAAEGIPSQQLLLSAGRGSWEAATEYRVLDFADADAVQEIFSASDSRGIVMQASNDAESLQVKLADGKENTAALPEGMGDGSRVEYDGLFSLTAHDIDGDGQQELFSSQQLTQRRRVLADVGAVWRLQAEDSAEGGEELIWKHSSLTIMTAPPLDRSNTVNDGADFSAGAILPRKLVIPGGEATYPVFAAQDVALQNKINALLDDECADYLQRFYSGAGDMAFKIMHSDDLLLSIQLISGTKQGFSRHNVNIDPQTGERIALTDILQTQDADLYALLNLLSTNKKMDFSAGLPEEWYIEGRNLFLLQRIDDANEVAGFALGNLHKFLKDKKWLSLQKAD